MFRPLIAVCAITLLSASLWAAEGDILVADFEGADYGEWKTTGEAFGSGPARGKLGGQMDVGGFQGKGLANSYLKGDGAQGTLTSPPFKIERKFINFLIGGGGYEKKTCMNLRVGKKVVRTAVGPNTQSGGSENLAPHAWDVVDLRGKMATIQIVDARTGGWGHINVDQIVQSDKKAKTPPRPGRQTLEMTITKKYILFPIRGGVKKTGVDVSIGGKNIREFDAELATDKDDVDFWSFLDMSAFQGEKATLTLSAAAKETAALIRQSDEIPGADDFYTEELRPQFHFSQMLGWNNDPNGMVYYDGEWHLYLQHNPYGWKWGNMHWAHAVSKDLIHWEQLPIAIYNYKRGDWAFSGGAVVDENNTAGWQTGKEKVIVASWTSTGRGECVAYSNDRGRTFTEYEGNPVIKHGGRDPKIIWYEPGQHWVLVVYDQSKEDGRAIAFYSSNDMKNWKLESKLKGYYECAELFELPVDGDEDDKRWVVFAADAQYAIGKFDGKVFTPEHEGKHRVHYGNYYASQIFSNPPDGRRIQIGWARINMPGMPFNQTFTLPHRLTLRSTDDGVRMFAEPVKEVEKIQKKTHEAQKKALASDSPFDLPVSGHLFDISATFILNGASSVGLDIGGNRVTYDAKAKKLNGAALDPVNGKITMRVLIDRPMMEIIGNQGRVYITSERKEKGDVASVQAFAEGGAARLVSLEVHELESIWEKQRDFTFFSGSSWFDVLCSPFHSTKDYLSGTLY